MANETRGVAAPNAQQLVPGVGDRGDSNSKHIRRFRDRHRRKSLPPCARGWRRARPLTSTIEVDSLRACSSHSLCMQEEIMIIQVFFHSDKASGGPCFGQSQFLVDPVRFLAGPAASSPGFTLTRGAQHSQPGICIPWRYASARRCMLRPDWPHPSGSATTTTLRLHSLRPHRDWPAIPHQFAVRANAKTALC